MRHAPGFRSLRVFRECRGECEVEEAEQVQPLRRAVVGHRRSSHCTWALTQDGRSRRSMANVRRSTTRPIPFGGRSARCSTRTRCAWRTRRRPPSCKAGSITQQSASGGRDIPTGRRGRAVCSFGGLIPPVNNALVRAFANHKTLAPKKTIDTASRTLNARPGFPCDGVNREPHRKEAAGRQVGCSFLRVWSSVGSCKFTSALRCS